MNMNVLTAALLDDEARIVAIAIRDLFAAAAANLPPIRVYKPKNCTRCGTTFQPTGGKAKYCPECQPEAVRENVRRNVSAWRKANPEKAREQRQRAYAKRKQGATPA